MANITFGDGTIAVPCDETFILRNEVLDNQTLAAGARKAYKIPMNVPDGYVIGAYRQVSIENGSNAGTGRDNCFIQFFSTTGGGKNAQIAVKNAGNTDAVLKIGVTVICIKEA